MKNKYILIALIIAGSIIGCSKANLDKLSGLITISGITARDANGTLIGTADTTDWTTEVDIPAAIVSKLNFSDTLDYSSNDSTGTITITAYPNPYDSIMALHCQSSGKVVMKYVIVDDSLKTYSKNTLRLASGTNIFMLNLSDSTIKSGKLYRMYYAFLGNNKNVFAKGHGDIQKK